MELPLQLKAYAESVDRRLGDLLPNPEAVPTRLSEAIRYSCLAPGKRLRPALVLASCEAVGGTIEDGMPGACAVEMVHAFSLIHDDLPAIDDDDLRRGQPTCHVKFGEAIAILAGDALFALAFSTIAEAGRRADSGRALRVTDLLSQAAMRLVYGEALDILSEGRPVDKEVLTRIHADKTGALIAVCCAIGGIYGGGSDAQVEGLRTYGAKVGLAFQIVDDILNETSTPEQLGKAAGSDRERQKATFPAIYGLDASQKAALDAAQEGIDALDGIPNREILIQLAEYSVSRLR